MFTNFLYFLLGLALAAVVITMLMGLAWACSNFAIYLRANWREWRRLEINNDAK
jgi:hypothetical protein